MAVTDGDGNILYRFVYDTYGELSDIQNGNGASLKTSEEIEELTAGYTLSELASAAGIEYLYNGQYGVSTDQNGLYYMRARYYNQDIKRFINRDVVSGEITNSGSLNRYCYVQGNPVSLTDPFGLCPDSNSAFKNLCSNLYHMDWNAVGHSALDVAGIFFDGADVINAIWYACEGNMEMAAVSAISALAGASLTTNNLLMKGNKITAAERTVKAVANMVYGTIGVCAGISMAKTGFTNFLNGLEAGTFDAGALLQTLGGIGIAMLSGKGLVSSGRELQACTANSEKSMKGSLIDADISNVPIESEGMATYAGGNAFKGGSGTQGFIPPEIYKNADGVLTNGVYTIDPKAMNRHRLNSLNSGKSQFLSDVDTDRAVLDAAAYADQYNLWEGSDHRNKAKVPVVNGPVGVVHETGELTNYINVYRKNNGLVHGAPGSPPK
ncbi:MAG: RHS repeat-associated core domain-containing protein [Lachnospiraceae bacterium]|nr:RHS repeat-associated core domain-containing protein [Lachnospiraceae bacterium]